MTNRGFFKALAPWTMLAALALPAFSATAADPLPDYLTKSMEWKSSDGTFPSMACQLASRTSMRECLPNKDYCPNPCTRSGSIADAVRSAPNVCLSHARELRCLIYDWEG